ncbi:MAG: hypothetical protein ACFCUR_09035 [Rhodomicrobiaceae bacterium]
MFDITNPIFNNEDAAREHLSLNVDAKIHLMTNDSNVHISAGKKFAGHSSVRDQPAHLLVGCF